MIDFIGYFTAAVIAISPIQDSKARTVSWNNTVAKISGLSQGEQLRQVNTYFNHMRYVFALSRKGRPIADVVAKGGNCVDFSNAKRQMLLDLGWKPEFLKEIDFKRPTAKYGHRVLAVHLGDTYQVLDLGRDDPWLAANYFLPNDNAM